MVMPMGMMGMGAPSGNVYQYYRGRYSCGYADTGVTPKPAPYPMDIVALGVAIPKKKSAIIQFLEKLC